MISVFDIDGVLADASHREHHVTGKPKNWDAFFDEVGGDAVIEAGRDRLLDESSKNDVVLLSGRPERCRVDTQAWLSRHGFGDPALVLRPDHDRRRASVFKDEAIRSIGSPDQVAVIVDDDAAVVARLAELGYHAELFSQPLR